MNKIVTENSQVGAPASEWDIIGTDDGSIEGFATEMSVNLGETVHFKINSAATAYRLDIYRMGSYAGNGARKVATIRPSVGLPQFQPPGLSNPTGVLDCGNWAVSASWPVPTDAVSGIYFAKLVREDGNPATAHVLFIVRDDDSHSDLLFQTSDTTWQAYNTYGASMYSGGPGPQGGAYKVSYNRPITTRKTTPEDWVFNAEYPMVRWLEANGYDVSYCSGVDTDRFGDKILRHKVFLSVGHDEYWSAQQRANVEAARDAGVHLAFFSGNEVFWKTRWEKSIDGFNTPYRTLVCYKDTHANAPIDPTGVWTGTWRDPRFNPPADGGRPENALTGTIFGVQGFTDNAISVSAEEGKLRFWHHTTMANLAAGTEDKTTTGTLGYEWDEDIDNGFRPAGLIRLSSTFINTNDHLLDNGSSYGPATVTHHLTLYRHQSGALVFSAGTAQWSWGLDSHHDLHGNDPGILDHCVQQAMVNLFADMGVQPASLQSGLVPASASTDSTAPTSSISFPSHKDLLQPGQRISILGSATDIGGIVAAVEVSVNGGLTWHPAVGRESWSYSWMPMGKGLVTILSRAVDDSGNIQNPATSVDVIVGEAMEPDFTPLQLDGLLAWYRSDRGITQANCARFVSVGSNFLSTDNVAWLDGWNRLTIAMDVRLNDVTAWQAWVSRWGANAQFILRCQGGANPGAVVFIVANGLSDPGGNYVITQDNLLRPGVPVRIVAVFDTGVVTIYANGAVVATTTVGTIPASLTSGSGADLRVGTDLLPSFIRDGLMSRLCIWAGTALTPAQVAADFNIWIGVDPALGEPVTPTHAWRLDEAGGTRHDCVGDIDLSDNNDTGSEAHVTRVEDLSGNGFHAKIRPINGPVFVDNGLGGKPTIRHSAANWQFLSCGLLSGPTKPPAWSLYVLAMCTGTAPAPGQTSQGLFNTFGGGGADIETWIVCVLSDVNGSGAPAGSFGMGCGDDAHYNQANSPASVYSANVWFQLTGIFPGGATQVNTWLDGGAQHMTFISGARTCACAGVAHPAVIGAATVEGTGMAGFAAYNNDFFDGQWTDIAVCGADTSSQREAEEAFQRNWFTEP